MGIFQQNWDFYCILIFVTIRLKCNKILILVKKFSKPDFSSNQPILLNESYKIADQYEVLYISVNDDRLKKYDQWELELIIVVEVTEKLR